MKTVSEVIRDIRTRRCESMEQFGALLGVRKQTVSQYERGQINPRRYILQRLAGLAGTSEERQTLRDALGWGDEGKALHEVDDLLDQRLTKWVEHGQFQKILSVHDLVRNRLAEQLIQLVSEDAPASYPLILSHMIDAVSNPVMVATFDAIAGQLESGPPGALDFDLAATDEERQFLTEMLQFYRVASKESINIARRHAAGEVQIAQNRARRERESSKKAG